MSLIISVKEKILKTVELISLNSIKKIAAWVVTKCFVLCIHV